MSISEISYLNLLNCPFRMTETDGLLIINEHIEYYGHKQFIPEYIIKLESDLGITNRNYVAISKVDGQYNKTDIKSYFFTFDLKDLWNAR